MKDKWITPDNYHLQDLLDCGRCLYCGKLAQATQTHKGITYNHCGIGCSRIINKLIDEKSQQPGNQVVR